MMTWTKEKLNSKKNKPPVVAQEEMKICQFLGSSMSCQHLLPHIEAG